MAARHSGRAGLWWSGVLLALALCGLTGCRNTDVCDSQQVDVTQADGGAFRCVVPEDCPRPSNVSVCLTNNEPEKSCVSCVDTRCVETVITPCDPPISSSP